MTDSLDKEFEKKFSDIIQKKDVNSLCDLLINDVQYKDFWQQNCWVYVNQLYDQIREDTLKTNPEWCAVCEKVLEYSCDNRLPEEVLLELIERIELSKDDQSFISVLHLLRKILIKLSIKQEQAVEWTLIALKRYVCQLNCPEYHHLEGNEQMLLDSDDTVRRINDIYDVVVYFVRFLMEHQELQARNKIKVLCACFLLQLFNRPFSCLDLSNQFTAKSKSRLIAEEIMYLLSKLLPDKFMFLTTVERSTKTKDPLSDTPDEAFITNLAEIPLFSLGTFYYLLLAENIEIETAPCVYSSTFIFQQGLHLVVVLIKEIEEFIIYKGLSLAKALILRVSETVSHILLDSTAHCHFIKTLLNIMIYNTVKSHRFLAKEIFDLYFEKFTAKARYLLIINIFENCKHSGVVGLLIYKYKESLMADMKNENLTIFFKGPCLRNIIEKFSALPEGVETDLMNMSDQIFTFLNFLIFLHLRDTENRTGIWDLTQLIQEQYLTLLGEAIELSKAHYESRKHEIERKDAAKGDGDGDDERRFMVQVGGDSLAHLPISDQLKAIDSALNGFDLMESLRVRVNECISSKTT